MDRFSELQASGLDTAEGEVSERFKVLAWKASVGQPTGGSNPPLSDLWGPSSPEGEPSLARLPGAQPSWLRLSIHPINRLPPPVPEKLTGVATVQSAQRNLPRRAGGENPRKGFVREAGERSETARHPPLSDFGVASSGKSDPSWIDLPTLARPELAFRYDPKVEHPPIH